MNMNGILALTRALSPTGEGVLFQALEDWDA